MDDKADEAADPNAPALLTSPLENAALEGSDPEAGISALMPEGAAPAVEDTTVANVLDKDGNILKSYDSIDQAIQEAADGATVQVTKDTTTQGINLKKNLTIEGVASTTKKQDAEGNVVETTKKPQLTFENTGIALWSKSLTFKNMQVVLNGIGTTPDTANNLTWMTVHASKDSTLTLDNTDMTMNGTGTAGNTHAIYFNGNDKLNVRNGSNLTIKNYKQDALEWDGGDGGYNVNITDGSTYTSDHNRSGFTGTFHVTVDDSTVKVLNSTGNGSNGSHFDIKNGSDVEFSNNGVHGLSAGNLNIEDSTVTANNNGYNGIIFTGKGTIKDSTVTITGTKGKSYWNAGMRLFKSNATMDIVNSTVTIKDNEVSGIFCDSGSKLTIDDSSNVTVTGNNAAQENCSTKKDLAQSGGGLVVRENASAKLGAKTTINNNHATVAGDDIFVEEGGKLTFSVTNAGTGDTLNDCGDKIDGWYTDANGQRWNFHGEEPFFQNLLDSGAELTQNEDGTYTITAGEGGLALKAAHAELPAPEPTPNPEPTPDPDTPDTPVSPEDPTTPPVQDVTPDEAETPVSPENPANPSVQDATPDSTVAALPKTGVNWFTALAMALSGMALTVAGAFTSLFAKSKH